MRRVLIEGWQMQCCGDPFEIGSTVSWTAAPISDREFLGAVLGTDSAASITDIEDHHNVDPVGEAPLAGLVRSITAVFCSYAPRTASAQARYPVAGTASLERRERADGRERDEPPGRVFVGYLVDLDENAELPPPPPA